MFTSNHLNFWQTLNSKLYFYMTLIIIQFLTCYTKNKSTIYHNKPVIRNMHHLNNHLPIMYTLVRHYNLVTFYKLWCSVTYQVVDNVTTRGAATTVTEPLPGCGAENDACWVVYATVGASMWRQVLAIKLIILIILKCQLSNCTRCRLHDAIQSICQHVQIFSLQSFQTSIISGSLQSANGIESCKFYVT